MSSVASSFAQVPVREKFLKIEYSRSFDDDGFDIVGFFPEDVDSAVESSGLTQVGNVLNGTEEQIVNFLIDTIADLNLDSEDGSLLKDTGKKLYLKFEDKTMFIFTQVQLVGNQNNSNDLTEGVPPDYNNSSGNDNLKGKFYVCTWASDSYWNDPASQGLIYALSRTG